MNELQPKSGARITIRDLAERCGVSVATASMALNGRAGVKPSTRQRILEAAEQLNYIPNHSARALAMRDSNCVGLMVPEIRNPFYSDVVDAMFRIAEDRGFELLLGVTNNRLDKEADYARLFLSQGVMGIIAIPVLAALRQRGFAHWERVREKGIPVVFCTERYDVPGVPAVMCDFERGQYEMVRHLIGRGVRDFTFVSAKADSSYTARRFSGYRRALEEAGIPVREDRLLLLDTPSYDLAYAAAGRILDDLPGAVVCINDVMAVAIMKYLMEHGVGIPEDVCVAGFDDIALSQLVVPALSTVRQPVGECCERSVAMLFDMLSDGQPTGDLLVAPELVIRRTTR